MTKLKEVISTSEYSAHQVAMKAGISPPIVYDCMNGKRTLYPGWRKRIAEVLGVDESELIEPIQQGERNNTLYAHALTYLKQYGDTPECWDLFYKEAEQCTPPLQEKELSAIKNGALKAYMK